ncbi:hypothetical protein ACFL42_03425 [Candidatus Omnitrophota bacterium]
MIVVDSHHHKNIINDSPTKDIKKWSLSEGLDINISLGITTKGHLKVLKPYIFTIETKRFGKVLWGDEDILSLIPDYSYKDIDPVDGYCLLNNRIVEQLIVLGRLSSGYQIADYEITKGYVQLVNSILALKGRYASLYFQKKEAILKLIEEDPLLSRRVASFIDKIVPAFDSIYVQDTTTLTKDAALFEWRILRDCFRQVWIYETQYLTGANAQEFIELSKLFTHIPKPGSWIRHWGKYYLSGGMDLPRPWTIPQYQIYQRAISIYFDKPVDLVKAKGVTRDWERFVK